MVAQVSRPGAGAPARRSGVCASEEAKSVLLGRVLYVTAVLATAIAAPSAFYAGATGVWLVTVVDVVAVGAIWWLAMSDVPPYVARVTGLLLLASAVGVVLFLSVAPVSAMFLVMVPLLAAVFLDRRHTIGWFVAVTVLIAVLGLLPDTGGREAAVLDEPLAWLVIASNLAFVCAVGTFAARSLLERLELALRRSDQLGEALEHLGAAIFVADADGSIIYRNAAARRLSTSPDEPSEQSVTMADLRDRMVIDDGRLTPTLPYRFVVEPADGRQYGAQIAMTSSPGSTVLLVRDITDELARDEQARRAEKLGAVSALAGGAAHELNNAMLTIRATAELMKSGIDDPEADSSIEQIIDACDRAAEVVRWLMLLGQQRPAGRQRHVVAEVVENARPRLQAMLSPGVTLTTTLDGSVAVEADRSEILHVLIALVDNAAHSFGGRSDGHVHVEVRGRGGRAELVVSDDGCGINAAALTLIFDPFFSGWDGSGLGLPSVQAIAQALGGHVTFESEVAVGSSFVVSLPEAGAEVGSAAPAGDADPADAAPEQALVLVVDDDPVVSGLVARHLERSGNDVLVARSAHAAAELLDRHAIDLVVTDLTMPDRSGLELAEDTRARFPDVGIVLMTGHLVGVVDADAKVDALLQKPFTRDELLACVAGVRSARRGIEMRD